MAFVTVAYVLFSSFTALFLDSLYTVVAMTGALGGSLIEAIIPAALYIKYVKEIRDVDAPWKTIGGYMVIALGAVIAVLGTYESLTQYFCFLNTFAPNVRWSLDGCVEHVIWKDTNEL